MGALDGIGNTLAPGGAVLADLIAQLRAAGCVFAEEEAALLLEAAEDPERLTELASQRVAGRPLEYILGWAEFRGIRVRVSDGVFVPRRRSEALVDAALAVTPPDAVVLDLCCGSGAIGAAMVASRPDVTLFAADLDPVAVADARRNLADRASVYEGDLFDPLPPELRGAVDVIVVNAPYVPTGSIGLLPPEARLHEHRWALDGGSDGLDLHRRIAAEAAGWLTPGGRLLIEASERQSPVTARLFEDGGLTPTILRDEERDATVVLGERLA
jgi:release factor glutamine methyltransferase